MYPRRRLPPLSRFSPWSTRFAELTRRSTAASRSTPQAQRENPMSTQEKLRQEIDRYIAGTPVSRQKQADAEKYLPGGSSRGTAYFAPHPHFIERGEGHYLQDVDGNRLLDFMINATSLVLGHAHPMSPALFRSRRRGARRSPARQTRRCGWRRYSPSASSRWIWCGSPTRGRRAR